MVALGDRAHAQKARRARLAAMRTKERTVRRANRWHPALPFWQRTRNRLIARRRAPGEAVFSTLKRHHGFARARYASFAGNAGRAFAALTRLNPPRARTRLAAAWARRLSHAGAALATPPPGGSGRVRASRNHPRNPSPRRAATFAAQSERGNPEKSLPGLVEHGRLANLHPGCDCF